MAGAADAQSWSPAPRQACAHPGCDEPPSGTSKFCSLECKESLEAEALIAKPVECATLDLAQRESQCSMREAALEEKEKALRGETASCTTLEQRERALEEKEKALRDLEEAMNYVKVDLAAQPTAPEVAQSAKRRPRRQDRGQYVAYVVRSPRKQSPRKSRSPTKARKSRISLASTTDASSCNSPSRRGHRSRPSCASWSSRSMEEPPPARLTEQELLAPEAAKPAERPHFEAPAESLLGSFPLPLGISAWEWPLSRNEKKSLVLMLDRQELTTDRDALADERDALEARLQKVRGLLG